jgi:2-oxo-4-hydroxy-4-carboxy-5-ureidoimidazoline decarboxylase
VIRVDLIDGFAPDEALRQLTHCCGSSRWARAMTEGRPYGSEEALLAASTLAFAALRREDWLEAFRHHPQIGDVDSLRRQFAATAHLAGQEQAGVQGASEEVLQALAAGNREYEAKFGYIFIVCATGKSAAEMLALLRARLGNSPAAELQNAAAEQRQITRIRLEKIGA